MQNTEIKKKQEESCEKTTGHKNPFSSKHIQEKIAQKNILNYDFKNPTQNKDIKKKQEDTNEILYGKRHALQVPSFRQKAMDTCIINHGHFPANNYGKTQKDIQDWLNSFGFDFKSNRTIMQGSEIDLFDEQSKLAIEYCGLHWHNELSPEPRKADYHHKKYQRCLEKGIQLLTIFSDEWEKRQFQCKSHIKSILKINDERIFARKCVVKQIEKEVGRRFFEENHIQGKNGLGRIFFGLFFEDTLCGAISLGRHNRQVDALVLDRLCFKDGIQIVGGASKLFARCVEWSRQNGHQEILSFSDNRWSLGRVYTALSFELMKDYSPDYSYVNVKSPNERLSKQSQKKGAVNCPEGLTEYDWAHQRGLARIWDCGKKRWVFKINKEKNCSTS